MTKEQIRERLSRCRVQENEFNKEMSKLNYQIKFAKTKIKKLALKVSKNMKYRNQLIDLLKQ